MKHIHPGRPTSAVHVIVDKRSAACCRVPSKRSEIFASETSDANHPLPPSPNLATHGLRETRQQAMAASVHSLRKVGSLSQSHRVLLPLLHLFVSNFFAPIIQKEVMET